MDKEIIRKSIEKGLPKLEESLSRLATKCRLMVEHDIENCKDSIGLSLALMRVRDKLSEIFESIVDKDWLVDDEYDDDECAPLRKLTYTSRYLNIGHYADLLKEYSLISDTNRKMLIEKIWEGVDLFIEEKISKLTYDILNSISTDIDNHTL